MAASRTGRSDRASGRQRFAPDEGARTDKRGTNASARRRHGCALEQLEIDAPGEARIEAPHVLERVTRLPQYGVSGTVFGSSTKRVPAARRPSGMRRLRVPLYCLTRSGSLQ